LIKGILEALNLTYLVAGLISKNPAKNTLQTITIIFQALRSI
jgi:hypothetical protein